MFAAKSAAFRVLNISGYGDVAEQVGEWRQAGQSSVSVEKWRVRLTDCELGYGTVYTFDMSGRMSVQNDFVLGGSSIASSIADYMCAKAK